MRSGQLLGKGKQNPQTDSAHIRMFDHTGYYVHLLETDLVGHDVEHSVVTSHVGDVAEGQEFSMI